MASPIEIRINGDAFVDFKRATVSFGMEEFSRSFFFEFSDKWLRTNVKPLPFVEGDPVEVFVHGTKVVDGFIDDIPIDYDANQHSIGVSGRSWTGHMVDCSAVYKGGSWRNASLIDIVGNISEPFGCIVQATDPQVLSPAAEKFRRWAIEDEETAYDCISRAAKLRGLFLLSDHLRDVIIAKSSKVVNGDRLKLGENILRARRVSRFTERHSYYLVKSQTAGDDTWWGDEAVGPFFRVDDPQVTAYRPLIMVSDGGGGKAELKTRATWERNVRAGRSRRISYDVQGFKNRLGALWPMNELIAVDDPYSDIKDTLLIISVSFNYSEKSGEVTTLDLGRPEAFDVLAPAPKAKKGRKKFY